MHSGLSKWEGIRQREESQQKTVSLPTLVLTEHCQVGLWLQKLA